MFIVTESDAAAIRDAFHKEGELSAIIELRQRFPGIDHAKARACARTIAGWQPPSAAPCPVVPLRPGDHQDVWGAGIRAGRRTSEGQTTGNLLSKPPQTS